MAGRLPTMGMDGAPFRGTGEAEKKLAVEGGTKRFRNKYCPYERRSSLFTTMSASSLDRRRFLKLSLGSAAFAAAWGRPSDSFAYGAQGSLYRSIVPEGATPTAKGINATWLASLRVRETSEPTFTKAANQLRYIGMPVGGIACGTLYLGGDGRLWLCDVWHKSGEGIRPRSRYYAHPSGINDPATVIDPRGNVTNPASADTDGDGTKDGVEARLGTDPLDGSDYFQPLISRNASGQTTLTWPSATGTSFTIERSTSLLGWAQIATNLVGQSGHTSYTDTTAPAAAAQMFYRVRLD